MLPAPEQKKAGCWWQVRPMLATGLESETGKRAILARLAPPRCRSGLELGWGGVLGLG